MWLATLLGLLLHWIIDTHRIHYSSMGGGQNIAYISDVGAAELKPLFIVGCCITTIFLDLSFATDRWLRHKGRLVPNTTRAEKILSGLTIFFAIVGTIGLCFLSGFDTARYPQLHDIFLLLFIAGYLLSAIFICWEYQRLGISMSNHPINNACLRAFPNLHQNTASTVFSVSHSGSSSPLSLSNWCSPLPSLLRISRTTTTLPPSLNG